MSVFHTGTKLINSYSYTVTNTHIALCGKPRINIANPGSTYSNFSIVMYLKVPGPIASDFFQTFGDFGIRRKLIFFSLPLVNFTAEKIYRLGDINENVTSYGNHN